MHTHRFLSPIFLLALAWAGLVLSSAAEIRVFTDSTGRTLKGELVGVSGDNVTIKREDGQTFTFKAGTFCQSDLKYFHEHGWKGGGDLDAAGAGPSGKAVLMVEALIDGPSELRVKTGSVYWINGENAKPGWHDQNHEVPTYVNGKAWLPVWKKQRQKRGVDHSNPHDLGYSLPEDLGQLKLSLISVSIDRGSGGIEKRDPIKVRMENGELAITIPDSQSGARWYKFALTRG